jgi:hypothetical protein
MAAVNAFNQALTRVGFNVDTTEAIIDEGFDTLKTLATVDEKDIDLMIKNICDTCRELGPGAEGAVTFPFLAIKRLKAMRFWVTELVRTGRQLNAGLFNGAEINLVVQRYSTDGVQAEIEKDEDPDKPGELSDLTKWEVFWERWCTYASRLRGAAKCPLTYIFRDKAVPEPADFIVDYETHDDYLVALTVLNGAWYDLDNRQIYDEFKGLVLKGPEWTFVKTFDRAKDGRNAVLTLKRQCEGTSAVRTRKASAYARIASAKYSGQKRNFTFDQYVQIHQAAYNTLADSDEAVPETKKVTDFLAGIGDPKLANAKDLILGDLAKLQNFEACQQCLKTLVYNKATQDKHERQISGVSNTKAVKRQGKRGNNQKGDISSRSYSKEEWAKLTEEQRDKIRALHAGKKSKLLSDIGGGRGGRSNVSSITQGTGDVVQHGADINNNKGAAPSDAATQVTNGSASRQGAGRG